MLVFSTCWNSHRHQDGEEMIDEILSLGFDHVELSHGIKLSLLPGIMRAVKAGKVQVAGVHNFSPLRLTKWGILQTAGLLRRICCRCVPRLLN